MLRFVRSWLASWGVTEEERLAGVTLPPKTVAGAKRVLRIK